MYSTQEGRPIGVALLRKELKVRTIPKQTKEQTQETKVYLRE